MQSVTEGWDTEDNCDSTDEPIVTETEMDLYLAKMEPREILSEEVSVALEAKRASTASRVSPGLKTPSRFGVPPGFDGAGPSKTPTDWQVPSICYLSTELERDSSKCQ
jgi:hypothetical protein